jgi:hypothetical protein
MHCKRKAGKTTLENEPPIKKQRIVLGTQDSKKKWESTLRLVPLAAPKLAIEPNANTTTHPHTLKLHAVGVFILRAQRHLTDAVEVCIAPPATPLPTIESFYRQGCISSISIFATKRHDQQHTALCISALLQLYQAVPLWQLAIFSQLQPFLALTARQSFKKQLDHFVVDGLRSQDVAQTVAYLALDLHPIPYQRVLKQLVQMWKQLGSLSLLQKSARQLVNHLQQQVVLHLLKDCSGLVMTYVADIRWLTNET